ncbi:hypothetical protein KCH_16420 [Kitasatospora cheerisanensis KCTC 2395]|uniref:Uncharacterized protein n=1 Tax=Kitasatospora cheerisanensis KCTC 2395 TaxID=1348663 RepID=A0A066Z889_9ACTN|nr:hypothetical protein KCH_16420 [Kitasatospora cheerisanensis KCTC 2395]
MVDGPQPPHPGLVRGADRLAQFGVALRSGREAAQDGGSEAEQGVVGVAQGEFVEGPGPVGPGGGVGAQQVEASRRP